MDTNNNPVGGFTGHSTGEREKYELITAENTERSGWVEAMNATTITSMLHVERIKKVSEIYWKERGMDSYAIRIKRSKSSMEEIGAFSQFIIPGLINYRSNYTPSMVSQSEEIMNFNKIYYEDKEIKLRTPIEIKPKLSNQRYILHYELLDIIVSAPTLEECKEDFQEELDVLYEIIGREDDEKLIKSAQIIKRKLLTLIVDET
ncbi:hypothetical protein C5S29_13720 [ANME-1 cluster archaeon GoMg3.2]|nr:hypothetical protein [ANME-1 cluster archaeon GoMg3.2]